MWYFLVDQNVGVFVDYKRFNYPNGSYVFYFFSYKR